MKIINIMKTIRNLLPIFLLIIVSMSVKAQVSVNLYPLDNTIGVTYGKFDKMNIELRSAIFYSNSDGSSFGIEPELLSTFKFKGNEFYRMFIGIGVGYGYNYPSPGYVSALLPFGFEIKPFEKLLNFSFHTEISPTARFFDGYMTLKFQPRLSLCLKIK